MCCSSLFIRYYPVFNITNTTSKLHDGLLYCQFHNEVTFSTNESVSFGLKLNRAI